MKKKKVIIGVTVAALLCAAIVTFVFLKKSQKDTGDNGRLVYVESLKNITGNSLGLSNRYMGVVESQETKNVQKDDSKKVKELYVSEGDTVSEGDKLFAYDTADMELELKQKQLELEGINNSITTYNAQIKDLKAQRNEASADDKLGFTSQINNLQSQVKEEQYNLSVKQLEIDRQKQSIDAAVVTAPMSGVIKSINNTDNSGSASGDDLGYDSGMNQGDSNAFITIMAIGDYRIKGTVSEQNVYELSAGTPVIIRSRVDESVTWTGTISTIDMEPQSNNNDYYGNNGEGASNYSFYVELNSFENLMLGQHVYIEMDNGQLNVKDGLWLPSYYVILDGDNKYVWVKNKKDRIEKVKLSVGEYDENTDCYEILGGLTEDDYIAYPEDGIVEGSKTTTNYDDVMNQEENIDEIMPEEGMDGEMPEEGIEGVMPEEGMDGIEPDANDTESIDGGE